MRITPKTAACLVGTRSPPARPWQSAGEKSFWTFDVQKNIKTA